MSNPVLPQLDFSMSPPNSDVRPDSRTNVRLVSSDVYSPESSNLIRFRISGNSWVDMESIALYATVKFDGNSNFTTDGIARCHKPSTGHLIDNFRWMNGGGQVIVECPAVYDRYEMQTRSDGDKDYLDSTLNISSGGHSDPSLRPNLYDVAARKLRIAALDICPFIHANKYVYLPAYQGSIVLEMVLNTNQRAFTTRGAGTATFELSNTELRYDTVEVSDSFQNEVYNPTFAEGYTIPLQCYSLSTNTTTDLSNATLQLNKVLTRVRSINTVVRTSSQLTNANKNTYHYQGNTAMEYSYQIGSKRYPAHPVNNSAQSYQELLKLGKNHKNSAHSPVITYDTWNLDNSSDVDLNATDIANDPVVCHMTYPMELEQTEEENSGTRMSASDQVSLSLTGTFGTGPYVVSTFIDYVRWLQVGPEGILISD